MKFFVPFFILLAFNFTLGTVQHGFQTLELNTALLTENDSTFPLDLDDLNQQKDMEFDVLLLWVMCTASCPGYCTGSLFSPRTLYRTTANFTDPLLNSVLDISDPTLFDSSRTDWVSGYHDIHTKEGNHDPYFIYQAVSGNYVLFRILREKILTQGTPPCNATGPGTLYVQYMLQDDGSLLFTQFPDTSGIENDQVYISQLQLRTSQLEGIKVDVFGRVRGEFRTSGVYFVVNEWGRMEKKVFIKK